MIEETTSHVKDTLEAFFQRKYGPVNFQYHQFLPQGDDKAKIDFTISGKNNFKRRYVGSATVTNGQLSTGDIVRLW
jgi:hypothetical protein